MLTSRAAHCFLFAACAAVAAMPVAAQPIPGSTAIPIVFTRTIAAGDVHPGDAVRAKTLEAVALPGGRTLPAGSVLAGSIVAASPFQFDATPYASQRPSVLSIRFESIAGQGGAIPVNVSVRAIAGPVASHEAEIPHGLDEIDWSATRTLIGGDTTSALDKTVLAPDGSVVGYNRGEGVYARLLASVSAHDPGLSCDATSSEQAVAVFSPDACGVYGLNTIALADNGAQDNGTFVLESRQGSVRLYAGTTALLEEVSH